MADEEWGSSVINIWELVDISRLSNVTENILYPLHWILDNKTAHLCKLSPVTNEEDIELVKRNEQQR